MWAVRGAQRQSWSALSLLDSRMQTMKSSRGQLPKRAPSMLHCPISVASGPCQRQRGRSMRSKVEKRMHRETQKTLREIRRARKLRKKLLMDKEQLIYNLRREIISSLVTSHGLQIGSSNLDHVLISPAILVLISKWCSDIGWYQQARKWNKMAIPILIGTKFDGSCASSS